MSNLPSSAEFPLPDPFAPPPAGAQARWQCSGASDKAHVYQSHRRSCDYHIPTALLLAHAASSRDAYNSAGRKSVSALLFRLLVLTDCCSLYRLAMRIHPTSQGKCAKLALNQLRRLREVPDISIAGNSRNLGAMQRAGPLNILTLFLGAGRFRISFRCETRARMNWRGTNHRRRRSPDSNARNISVGSPWSVAMRRIIVLRAPYCLLYRLVIP